MPVNFRLPKISGNTEEQLAQIKSFLYRQTEELNYAFFNTGSNEGAQTTPVSQYGDTAVKFSEIKALILKDSDIVGAYFNAIDDRLRRKYVADSGDARGWTYDKRTDGTYEAWGIFDLKPSESSEAGRVYISDILTVPAPFPLSTAVIAGSCEADAWLCRCSVADADTDNCAVAFALASGNQIDTDTQYKVSLTIRGRWNNNP